MKWFQTIVAVAAAVLASLAGCKQRKGEKEDSAWQGLILQLDQMGYWAGLSEEEKQVGFEAIVRESNLFMLDHPRFFSGDDESLAEFGIADFLEEHRDRIREFGGILGTAEDLQGEDDSYRIVVDGRTYEVYTRYHLQAEERGEWNIWKRAAKVTQLILNDSFEQGGSKTRAYWYSGGNDAFVWFLIPDMATAIRDSGLLRPHECPTVID